MISNINMNKKIKELRTLKNINMIKMDLINIKKTEMITICKHLISHGII
jgi:hypothetical protein